MTEPREEIFKLEVAQGALFFCCTTNEKPADAELLERLAGYRPQFLGPRFERFFAENPSALKKRQVEWAESRRCLVELLDNFAPADLPRISLSLSHTRQASVVAAYMPADEGAVVHEIGVDIEWTERRLSPQVAAKFVRPGEPDLGLSPLQIWSVKEACFKANARDLTTVVADYEITHYDAAQMQGQCGCDKNAGSVSYKLSGETSLELSREDSNKSSRKFIYEFTFGIAEWRGQPMAYALAL